MIYIKKLREKKTGCWINGDFVGIVGYADDNFLMSPTLDGLQEMLDTCEEYANEHNLTFSTNDNPNKSKTKCMAFLRKKRTMANMTLCEKKLPWVDYVRHLGNTIVNNINGMSQDIIEKRAQYITRNNELLQEFSFAHPSTKCLINNVFNTHFNGSSLWNLFNNASEKLEKSWNVSQRLIFSLPRETHKYLIEPVSETQHIKQSLMKRFSRFSNMISGSKKNAMRNLYNNVSQDCQSTTGYNLRRIMLHSDLTHNKGKYKDQPPYYAAPPNQTWRINLVKELVNINSGRLHLINFSKEDILSYAIQLLHLIQLFYIFIYLFYNYFLYIHV